MRYGVSVVALACALVVTGCSEEDPAPVPQAEPSATPAPAYDARREPALAVLSLVPEAAQSLTVTDFDEVRSELGVTDAADAGFWARAEAERPLLSAGMLRPDPAALDVAWEAHFFDGAGAELGYVLAFREGAPLVRLPGATVDEANRLVTSGTTSDPEQSWAADPELTALVGLPANATYVARGCVPAGGGTDLQELDAYAVQYEGSLVTARLGEDRRDLFVRMRMALADPGFAKAFEGGVADPLTGRIGYVMADPPAAAERALEQRLLFAACA